MQNGILKEESGIHTADSDMGNKYWMMRLYELPDGRWGWTTVTWRDTVFGGSTARVESELKYFRETNVGRSNHRGFEAQASSEMASRCKNMLDRGYVGPNGELGDRATSELMSPMLANKWNGYWDEFRTNQGTVFIQPKYDGVRANTRGEGFWSRAGKFFPEDCVDHIVIDPAGMPPNVVLDGELMLPVPEYTFQQSVSRVKKYRSDEIQRKLGYYIYDAYIPDLVFSDRIQFLRDMKELGILGEGCFIAPTIECEDVEDVNRIHRKFVEEGYEGSMIRCSDWDYHRGKRVWGVLKNKDMYKTTHALEEDFKIVDVIDGGGKESGAAIFICETDGGHQFRTRPRGSYELRQLWFQGKSSLIGKKLIVRFANWTDDGKPRFPIGMRLKEDFE